MHFLPVFVTFFDSKNIFLKNRVIEKSHGSYRVIKSFGVGHTEVEICRLEEKARQYIRELQGLANGFSERFTTGSAMAR